MHAGHEDQGTLLISATPVNHIKLPFKCVKTLKQTKPSKCRSSVSPLRRGLRVVPYLMCLHQRLNTTPQLLTRTYSTCDCISNTSPLLTFHPRCISMTCLLYLPPFGSKRLKEHADDGHHGQATVRELGCKLSFLGLWV